MFHVRVEPKVWDMHNGDTHTSSPPLDSDFRPYLGVFLAWDFLVVGVLAFVVLAAARRRKRLLSNMLCGDPWLKLWISRGSALGIFWMARLSTWMNATRVVSCRIGDCCKG